MLFFFFFSFFFFLLINEWQTFIEKRKGKETKVHSKLHEQTEGTKSLKKKKKKKKNQEKSKIETTELEHERPCWPPSTVNTQLNTI
jgi:hypothetical protein